MNFGGLDNLEVIKPLLQFESDDDFYYLQILQRKKENPDLGSNSRVIKNYYINSVEYLEDRYDEIRTLCHVFNARAMLRLNKRSYEKVAFKTLINTANTMSQHEYNHIRTSYDRAIGQNHNDKDKVWILDYDLEYDASSEVMKSDVEYALVSQIGVDIGYINDAQPYNRDNKIVGIVPSLNGVHLLTRPFNIKDFDKRIAIHKDNPTNLYTPIKSHNPLFNSELINIISKSDFNYMVQTDKENPQHYTQLQSEPLLHLRKSGISFYSNGYNSIVMKNKF